MHMRSVTIQVDGMGLYLHVDGMLLCLAATIVASVVAGSVGILLVLVLAVFLWRKALRVLSYHAFGPAMCGPSSTILGMRMIIIKAPVPAHC